ncbi:aspartate aminotransferase family protein [Parasediminibacterium sp. JCM 36343]|uniref:aspartate aminotransferase family protein n=1 Tax=Parasediminibacterium sp. JCM 36343 TaxID=3374279 RepID=UPI00397B0CA7
MSLRNQFLQHIAQTSNAPIGLEMVKAEGIYIHDADGKAYLDMISGFSVANIGHSHPKVVVAVQQQAAQYMHLIVYGEYIQQPQVAYAKMLTELLPASLNCVYFTNSGAEATEGAMKLAKRVTNRTKMIGFNKAYHGSTQGALSMIGDEYFRNAYRPLLPGITHVDYNSQAAINAIDSTTACVIMETVQAESGIVQPDPNWIKAIRQQCDKHCVLLILDEIQAGFGRTGSLWAFEQYGIVPDILLLGKALGGGMPLGAFIADRKLMATLTENPVLGHITTFGGHPVSCAAGKAGLEVLLEDNYIAEVAAKEQILLQYIQHPAIVARRASGLWMAVEFDSFATNHAIIKKCIAKGLITDWFLFNDRSMRIAPPLIITETELTNMCKLIVQAIEEVANA